METLSAWSNGQWIHLDLERNRYFGDAVAPNATLQAAQASAVARLRSLGGRPQVLVPSLATVAHYLRCAMHARSVRRQPIRDQLDLLRRARGPHPARAKRQGDVEHFAWLYQHIRNLRWQRPTCLEDSICCALFLRRYLAGRVSFHIGVVQPPFLAHAWVQVGDVLVNDTKGCVEVYSEILRLDL